MKLIVESSPHINSKMTTTHIMLDVVISLIPAMVASVILFSAKVLPVIAVAVIACVLFEYLWCKVTKKKNTVSDLSAVVTGLLFAYNLPPSAPLWQVVVGSAFAIIVVKNLFGGIGNNFVNPALAARVFMSLSFSSTMTNYAFPKMVPDALSSATPLYIIEHAGGEGLDFISLFLGNHGGVIGCTSMLALLIGGIYLCLRGVITPTIPLAYFGATYVFSLLFGFNMPFYSLFAGGLALGAIFMATDYTTSPFTTSGKIVFGIGCGFLTALIRTFANATEGVSYAILIMNVLVPFINSLTLRKPFGGVIEK